MDDLTELRQFLGEAIAGMAQAQVGSEAIAATLRAGLVLEIKGEALATQIRASIERRERLHIERSKELHTLATSHLLDETDGPDTERLNRIVTRAQEHLKRVNAHHDGEIRWLALQADHLNKERVYRVLPQDIQHLVTEDHFGVPILYCFDTSIVDACTPMPSIPQTAEGDCCPFPGPVLVRPPKE